MAGHDNVFLRAGNSDGIGPISHSFILYSPSQQIFVTHSLLIITLCNDDDNDGDHIYNKRTLMDPNHSTILVVRERGAPDVKHCDGKCKRFLVD